MSSSQRLLLNKRLPPVCSGCLASTTRRIRISNVGGGGGQSFEASFEVPLCGQCDRRRKIKYTVVALAAIVFGVLVFAVRKPNGDAYPALFIPTLLSWGFLLFAGLGGLFNPAYYAKGEVRFRNKRYQEIFEEANRRDNSK